MPLALFTGNADELADPSMFAALSRCMLSSLVRFGYSFLRWHVILIALVTRSFLVYTCMHCFSLGLYLRCGCVSHVFSLTEDVALLLDSLPMAPVVHQNIAECTLLRAVCSC